MATMARSFVLAAALFAAPASAQRVLHWVIRVSSLEEMRELIVDFVDGIYDTFDADHSESLEFDEVMQALQKSPEIDVWEVFGRTLINSS